MQLKLLLKLWDPLTGGLGTGYYGYLTGRYARRGGGVASCATGYQTEMNARRSAGLDATHDEGLP
jgi:hypothetical protein